MIAAAAAAADGASGAAAVAVASLCFVLKADGGGGSQSSLGSEMAASVSPGWERPTTLPRIMQSCMHTRDSTVIADTVCFHLCGCLCCVARQRGYRAVRDSTQLGQSSVDSSRPNRAGVEGAGTRSRAHDVGAGTAGTFVSALKARISDRESNLSSTLEPDFQYRKTCLHAYQYPQGVEELVRRFERLEEIVKGAMQQVRNPLNTQPQRRWHWAGPGRAGPGRAGLG
jgi:hypothetical protein